MKNSKSQTLEQMTIEDIKSLELEQVRQHPVCALCAYADFPSKNLIEIADTLLEANEGLQNEVYEYLSKITEVKDLNISLKETLENLKEVYNRYDDFKLKSDALIARYFELTVEAPALW